MLSLFLCIGFYTKSLPMFAPGQKTRCRVVLVGSASVGKTSILSQLVDHKFSADEKSTIGVNYQIYSTQVDSIDVELQVWDTAGQEKYRSLGPVYYRGALGAIAVYDITNRRTFLGLDAWIQAFCEVVGAHAKVAVVGNKADLAESCEVNESEGREFAERNGYLFFTTSARTGHGIEQIFDELARAVLMSGTLRVPNPLVAPAPASAFACPC
jgi:small GTP-binding protein